MPTEHTIQFRVRYDEADQMGVVHHSRYLTYFEMGRIELMRAVGLEHLEQEDRGEPLSIHSVAIRYLAPARYDDRLDLVTSVEEARGARVVFRSRLSRCDSGKPTTIADATVVAAAINAEGRVRRLSPRELAAFGVDASASDDTED